MSQSKPCRFYSQPGGCKRRECTFSHGPRAEHHPRPLTSANTTRPPSGRPVCSFYWSSRNCRDGSNCRFSHVENPSLSVNRAGTSSAVQDSVIPFLTDEGLAKVIGTGTDSLSPQPATLLTPGAVRSRLERFLNDNFRFKTSFDTYAFLAPLNSTLSTNPAWVCTTIR
jgi:hypothetical protein